MKYARLGESGMKISRIAYGNWLTHGSQIEAAQASACIHAALDCGITTFDTADAYADTAAETILGDALRGQRREGLEIITKVYFPTSPRGHNDNGLSRKHLREGLHGALRRLQTDYVDVYMAHRFDFETPLEETMSTFADLVREGKANYIGVSEWSAEQIRAAHTLAAELRVPLVVNEPQYSLLWRVIEAEVVPVCQELGVGQLVWSPVAQGVLTGKYLPGQPPPPDSRATDPKGSNDIRLFDFMSDAVLSRVQELRPIAADLGVSMAQLAIAWVLHQPNVSGSIIGASRPEQVVDNAKAADVALSAEILAEIERVFDEVVERDPRRTENSLNSSPRTRDFA